MRQQRLSDQLITHFDQALRSLLPGSTTANRPNPADQVNSNLNVKQSRHVAGLMRVNHCGEICAQALYHGQALTAKKPTVRLEMQQAAAEEADHLAWCEQRLTELNSHPSLLNPLWYGISFGMGAFAGMAGDQYSLGFVAETERQVSDHLLDHLKQLPESDQRSRAILEQMNQDELQHRDSAINAGAVELPQATKTGMSIISKLMTKTSYYL